MIEAKESQRPEINPEVVVEFLRVARLLPPRELQLAAVLVRGASSVEARQQLHLSRREMVSLLRNATQRIEAAARNGLFPEPLKLEALGLLAMKGQVL